MSLPRIKLNIPTTAKNNVIDNRSVAEERAPLIESSIILRVSNNLQQGLLSQSKDTNLIELLNYDDALTIQYLGLRKLVVIVNLNKLGLEGTEIYACELLDLPTITEVYKSTDSGRNMVKNGNISEIVYIYKKINSIEEIFALQFDKICHDEILLTSEDLVDEVYSDFHEQDYNEALKGYESLKRIDFKNKKKYEQIISSLVKNKHNLVKKPTLSNSVYNMCKNGLTPPLYNVAKRRQRKQLSLHEIQKLDFTLTKLVAKDMAAESVEFEFVSESEMGNNNYSNNYNSSAVDVSSQGHLPQTAAVDDKRDDLKNKLKNVIQQQQPAAGRSTPSEEDEEDEDLEAEEEESDLELELEKALLESPGSTEALKANGSTERSSGKKEEDDMNELFSENDNENDSNESKNKSTAANDDEEDEEEDDEDDDELAGLLEELNSLQTVKQNNIKSFESCKNQFMKERIMDRIKKIDKEISVLEGKVRIVRGGGLKSDNESEEEEEEEEYNEEEDEEEQEEEEVEETEKNVTEGKQDDNEDDGEEEEDVDALFSEEDDDENNAETAGAPAEEVAPNMSELERQTSENEDGDAEMMELFGGSNNGNSEENDNNSFMNQMSNSNENLNENENDDLDLDILRGTNTNTNEEDNDIDMSLFQ